MITAKVFKLECHARGKAIVLPADATEQRCPLCEAPISIQWDAARAEMERSTEPRPEASTRP